jgi:hypothetical protein
MGNRLISYASGMNVDTLLFSFYFCFCWLESIMFEEKKFVLSSFELFVILPLEKVKTEEKTNIKAWEQKKKRGNINKKRLPFQLAFCWKQKRKKRQQLLSRLMFVVF